MIVKNPFRKLVILWLDRAKRDHGPVVVKTAVMMFILLVSSIKSIFKTHRRSAVSGTITPTDDVLSSILMLMGFSIFLLVVIDQLHYYIRELRLIRKTIDRKTEAKQKLYGQKISRDERDGEGNFCIEREGEAAGRRN
ncbi:unnamed protein product [Victoria cruziana]